MPVELHPLFNGLAWATTALTGVPLRRFYADRFPPASGIVLINYGKPGR